MAASFPSNPTAGDTYVYNSVTFTFDGEKWTAVASGGDGGGDGGDGDGGSMTDAEVKAAYERNADTNAYTDSEQLKLAGIEVGSTADQTGAEIKAAYEAEADTNAFTDAEQTKLAGIATGATDDQTGAEIKALYEAEADTNAYTDAEKSKLLNIDAAATDDQTGAEIKALYEAEADTNAFTDAEQTKLAGIATGATDDQTGAEIKALYEAEADTNAYTDAEKTKLAGIATGAEVNVNADWTASSGDAEILNKPSLVTSIDDLSDVDTSSVAPTDGQALVWNNSDSEWQPGTITPGSSDAATLDGLDSTQFLRSDANDTYTSGTLTFGSGTLLNCASNDVYVSARRVSNRDGGSDGLYLGTGNANGMPTYVGYGGGSETLKVDSSLTYDSNTVWHAGNDGSGSTLDADLLDGQEGSYYLDYNNLNNLPLSQGGGAITTVDNGIDDTVQTSTTSTGTISSVTNNGSGRNWEAFPGMGLVTFYDQSDSDYRDWLEGLAALGVGDTFTVNWAQGSTTYTIDNLNHQPYTRGTILDIEAVNIPNLRFATNESSVTAEYSTTGTVRVITGSNNPIWDTSLVNVTINSVLYSTSDWTVSGSTATHNLSNPTISVGDSIVQVDKEHSLGATGDDNNTLTIYGNSSELLIKDGTTTTTIGSSGQTTIAGPLTAAEPFIVTRDGSTSDGVKVFKGGTLTSPSLYIVDGGYVEPNSSNDSTFIGGLCGTYLRGANTIGTSTFVGSKCGEGIETATNARYSYRNTAVGAMSMRYISAFTTDCTAVGERALQSSNTDNPIKGNTAIGAASLLTATSSCDFNTAVGYEAGYDLNNGNNNLMLGSKAGRSTSPSGELDTQSNNIVLGDNSITNAYIKVSWTVTSDGRDKTDVTDLNEGLDFIKALRPVTYKWDERFRYLPEDEPDNPDFVMPSILDMTPDGTHKGTKTEVGFIAQEVEAVEKQFGWANDCDDRLVVKCTDDHVSMGLSYERLVPILVKAVKELSDKNDALEARLAALEEL